MLALRTIASRSAGSRVAQRTTTKSKPVMGRSIVRSASKKPIVPEYSPHVTIYAFPLPAIVSVSNRFAGLGLAVGFWAAGAASLVCPTAVPALFACLKAYPFVLAIAKGLVAFPLSFHWFAGLRHLVWDNTNLGLESVEAVEMSSKIILGATAVSTVGAMLL